jgi:iron complex transport system substrate-binding protein
LRIVSLLGSATEIVYALGLERHLVGISHECDYPPGALALPRVSRPRFQPAGLTSGEIDAAVRRAMETHGTVYEVDVDTLRRLRPTHILTQGLCEVCAVPTGSVEEAVASLDGPVEIVPLDAHTVEEILHTIGTVADAAGARPAGEDLVTRLRDRIRGVCERVRGRPLASVLLLEWLDPPFSPGHWVPQMVELAGGRNLVGAAGIHSRQTSWDDLRDLDPDVLLVEPCGFDLEQAAADAHRHRNRLCNVAARAIEADRAWVLHSAWFSRSGPRIVEGIETLARLLHPSSFDTPASRGIARIWEPAAV